MGRRCRDFCFTNVLDLSGFNPGLSTRVLELTGVLVYFYTLQAPPGVVELVVLFAGITFFSSAGIGTLGEQLK